MPPRRAQEKLVRKPMGEVQQLDRTETTQNGLSEAALVHHGDAEAWLNYPIRINPRRHRERDLGQFKGRSQNARNGPTKAKPRQDRS